MRRLQNQMLRIRQHRSLLLRRTSPEQKNDRTVLRINRFDDCIRKLLPAFSLMGICLMRPHSQHGVQHQHALLRPFFQITVVWNIASQIIMQLLINIDKRRRHLLSRLHRKAKPMRLMLVMIRVLSQNHDLHLAKRRKMKCVENIIRRRIYHMRRIFFFHKRK